MMRSKTREQTKKDMQTHPKQPTYTSKKILHICSKCNTKYRSRKPIPECPVCGVSVQKKK